MIYGNYYCGKKRGYCLTENKVKDEKLLNEIKDAILSLRSLENDLVLVDLFNDYNKEYDKPIFFKVYKDMSFGKTNFYIVESGVRTKNGIINYRLQNVSKIRIMELFEEICLKRKNIDAKWMFKGESYDNKGKSVNSASDDRKRAIGISSGYWGGKLSGECAKFACYESVEILTELTSDISYGEALLGAYFDYDYYTKIKYLFDKLSYNPLVALAMGQVEYYGKIGKPNYKLAYKYFLHSAKIGCTEAYYYLGQMYKYGLYVKKDIQKYIKLNQSVYDFYVKNDAEYCMAYINEVIIELAKIEKQKRNLDKSIEYCLQAIKNAVSNSIHDSGISNTLGEAIKLLYELTEFDESDMNLFDLFYLFEKPCTVRISVFGEQIIAQSSALNGSTMIECGDKYFRNTQEFLNEYTIHGKRFVELYGNINDMEILR